MKMIYAAGGGCHHQLVEPQVVFDVEQDAKTALSATVQLSRETGLVALGRENG